MQKKDLSLLGYCIECGSRCCKVGKSIGSPILSAEEAERIRNVAEGCLKEVRTSNGIYFVIKGKEGTNECHFLTNENKCSIQNHKPMDCLCYPVKAVYLAEGSIKFIIDRDCPASAKIGHEFIEKAKSVAMKSIRRFEKDTYNHWLKNNVGWIENGKEID